IHCGKSEVTAIAAGRTFRAEYAILALPLTQLRRLKMTGLGDRGLDSGLVGYEGAAVRKIIAVYKRPFPTEMPREGVFSMPPGVWMMDNSDLEQQVFSQIMFLGGETARRGLSRRQVLSKAAAVLGPAALNPI